MSSAPLCPVALCLVRVTAASSMERRSVSQVKCSDRRSFYRRRSRSQVGAPAACSQCTHTRIGASWPIGLFDSLAVGFTSSGILKASSARTDKALLPQRVAVSKGSIQAPAPREPESRTRAAIVARVLVAPPRHLLARIKEERAVGFAQRSSDREQKPTWGTSVSAPRLPVGRRSQVLDINLVGASPSPSTRRWGSSPG